jgi:hypothetical protein
MEQIRMRQLAHFAGILIFSCLHVGCGGDSGESTATPQNLDAAVAAVNKMKKRSDDFTQQAKSTSAPNGKGGASAPKSGRTN